MLKFRAHHFMCTNGFQGIGYSSAFIKNYEKITNKLIKDPSTLIKVTNKLDDICGACPNQTKQKTCIEQNKISQLDQRHMEVLGICEGQVLSWNDALQIIKEKMSLEKFNYACAGCSWQSYGICENALRRLKTTSSYTDY